MTISPDFLKFSRMHLGCGTIIADDFINVDGASIESRYRNYNITTYQGVIQHSFPHHSAGPFGNDISGPWMTPDNFFRVLALVGLGWKDIHATNIDSADLNYQPNIQVKTVVNF